MIFHLRSSNYGAKFQIVLTFSDHFLTILSKTVVINFASKIEILNCFFEICIFMQREFQEKSGIADNRHWRKMLGLGAGLKEFIKWLKLQFSLSLIIHKFLLQTKGSPPKGDPHLRYKGTKDACKRSIFVEHLEIIIPS